MIRILLLGALWVAPLLSLSNLADPQIRNGDFIWFSLSESKADVLKRLGSPANIADFGDDFQAWHYHIGNVDHHDYSHYLVFRRSTGKLISVTRAFEQEQRVDSLFPASTTSVHYLNPSYGVRVRRLSNSRILIALGSTAPGQTTSQILLIAETELRHFHGWLHSQLADVQRTP